MSLFANPSPNDSPNDSPHIGTDTPPPTNPPDDHSGFYRIGLAYGSLVYRARWIILVLWLAGIAVAVPFAAQVGSVLQSGGYSYSGSESSKVQQILHDILHQPQSQLIVVFQSSDTPVSATSYQQEVNNFIFQARAYPHVISVTNAGAGKDGMTTFVAVGFDQGPSAVQGQVDTFRKIVPTAANGPANTYVTGDPAVFQQFSALSQTDVERAERYSLPVALIVLLFVFGTVVSALMPMVIAGAAVPVALALVYAIASRTFTNIFVLNVATIVGLGLSIDYSLFMTRRFREELSQRGNVREAVAWSVATSGEAILFSGLTVMVGFSGLFLVGIDFMSSFGLGGVLTVGASVLAALSLLPAVLGILGQRIFALRLPMVGRGATSNATRSSDAPIERGLWYRWARTVTRLPVVGLLLAMAALVALAVPALHLNVATYGSVALPASNEAQHGLNILSTQFPSASNNPVEIIAQTPDGSDMLTAMNLIRVDSLTSWLAQQPHVTSVTSLTSVPGAPNLTTAQLIPLYTSGQYESNTQLAQLVAATTSSGTTLISVSTNTPIDSTAGKQLIDTLRAGDQQQAEGLKVMVGGLQASSLDFTRYLYGNFPKAVVFVLIVTYLLLLVMFRSVVLPLKAAITNVLSLGAAYGALVFIFQQGHLSNLLSFTSSGTIDSTIPILIFGVLFGLSMDYEVFLLSRIREEWLRTRDNRTAIVQGMAHTGSVITSAALLFVIVTTAFAFGSLISSKEIGLGMTMAVVVDATIVRSLLVPSAMQLLGRWNWWLPGRPLPKERTTTTDAN